MSGDRQAALRFDAVSEDRPGAKWKARWERSWPAYREWFLARGGETGPARADCEAALEAHMPELMPLYRRLVGIAGGGDLAARFLSTWSPPSYLGGCSLAARADGGQVRLVRNYDLSPDLNEGFLLRSAWTGRPVMGMVEFLWGLSDGINDAGLAVALAYGGRREVGQGFGICTILRYLLETCSDVASALAVLERVPSHMAYNLVLADAGGQLASVELAPGGGLRHSSLAIATNHQPGHIRPDCDDGYRTLERRMFLENRLQAAAPDKLVPLFLDSPLYQTDYAGGFGTLFTADYDPVRRSLALVWPDRRWSFSLADFREGSRLVTYDSPKIPVRTEADALAALEAAVPPARRPDFQGWLADARRQGADWQAFSRLFMPREPTTRA